MTGGLSLAIWPRRPIKAVRAEPLGDKICKLGTMRQIRRLRCIPDTNPQLNLSAYLRSNGPLEFTLEGIRVACERKGALNRVACCSGYRD